PRFEEPLPSEPEAESQPPLPQPPEPLPPPPAAKRWSLFDFVRGKEARKVAAEPSEADDALAPPEPDTHEPPPLAPTSIPDLDRVQRPYDRPQFDRSEPARFDASATRAHVRAAAAGGAAPARGIPAAADARAVLRRRRPSGVVAGA